MELLGKYIQREDGSKVEALGLFDTYAIRQTPNRFNSLMKISFEGMTLLGYTSRFSHTYGLTEDIVFGHVEAGSGENAESKLEGIYSGNVLATYLSGPVLVANPDFAHWFLKKIGAPVEQLPCEDALRLAYDQRLKDFTRDDLEMA
jgi:CobQ-like glutamine amidotransferase family enzyme